MDCVGCLADLAGRSRWGWPAAGDGAEVRPHDHVHGLLLTSPGVLMLELLPRPLGSGCFACARKLCVLDTLALTGSRGVICAGGENAVKDDKE